MTNQNIFILFKWEYNFFWRNSWIYYPLISLEIHSRHITLHILWPDNRWKCCNAKKMVKKLIFWHFQGHLNLAKEWWMASWLTGHKFKCFELFFLIIETLWKKLIGLETTRNVSFLATFYYILNAQVEGLNLSLPNFQEIFLSPNRNFSTLPELRIATFLFSIRPNQQ